MRPLFVSLYLLFGFALIGCERNACNELACKFAMCAADVPPYASYEECLDQSGEAECGDAQRDCAACFVDSGRDVCTELLDIAADCEDACT
jgi:hypothetical protein